MVPVETETKEIEVLRRIRESVGEGQGSTEDEGTKGRSSNRRFFHRGRFCWVVWWDVVISDSTTNFRNDVQLLLNYFLRPIGKKKIPNGGSKFSRLTSTSASKLTPRRTVRFVRFRRSLFCFSVLRFDIDLVVTYLFIQLFVYSFVYIFYLFYKELSSPFCLCIFFYYYYRR